MQPMAKSTYFSLLLLFLFIQTVAASYNILDFGGKPDGVTNSANAFLRMWTAACGSSRPATIYVPKGSFLVGKARFVGPCRSKQIDIRIDGTLIAPGYDAQPQHALWLSFVKVQSISIYGGTLDGRGRALWACKASRSCCPRGAASLSFFNANNILIRGLTSIDSELGHLLLHGVKNVTVQAVKIVASGNSPNTDGIHVQEADGVRILNTTISTGDDCISIGSGTVNLMIQDVTCGPGHGISIGSLGKDLKEAGVENVTVSRAVFTGTQNGLRIKSWGRPSNGFVRRVTFQHAVMHNVQNPIVIDQNYCPHNKGCPGQVSGVSINGVTYRDIKGTSATRVAVKFDCSNSNPCRGIGLENIRLTYENKDAKSSCKNAHGSTNGFVVPPSCL